MADKNATAKKPNIFVRMKNYFKELFSEIKKITWPTPKQILKNSVIVLVAVVVSAVVLGGLNWLLAWLYGELIILLQAIF
ncbi:MAG: preprotein translocase subunit SecE [Clostridia bacterium]|nr:preprotein translocase subunit SecE [Clostridia bacterium]MBR2327028.1 preprotein translocase subunit SecE [Clostridia bacterium]